MERNVTMLARLTAVLCFIAVVIASRYGRALERAYHDFIGPVTALIALALSLLLLGIFVRRYRKHSSSLQTLLGAALILAMGWFVSEQFTVASSERFHIMKYGLLALALSFSFPSLERPRAIAVGFLLAFALGSSEECIQIFDPERYFDWRDIVLNGFGALTGSVLALLFKRSRGRGSKPSKAT
ncbi:MAG: VanZ family protein [Bdellovibrionales bacterium]|nr:VanZ family protein [Bdellovibrionales bacterium]